MQFIPRIDPCAITSPNAVPSSRSANVGLKTMMMMMWGLEVAKDFLSSRYCKCTLDNLTQSISLDLVFTLTIDSGIVGLDVGTFDFAILSHQSVTLATVLTEHSGTLEREVEVLGELTGWIAEEADL